MKMDMKEMKGNAGARRPRKDLRKASPQHPMHPNTITNNALKQ